MIIEIKGVQFANRGAHLMLSAVMERVGRIRPDAEFAIAPHPLAPFPERARIGVWQKLPLRRRGLDLTELAYRWPASCNRALRRYGIVTERDVDAVFDASGFAYGDPWSAWASVYAADEVRRLARRKRPYVFLPQAFGPFSSPRAVRRLAQALPQAALICARDKDSCAHLRSLGAEVGDRIMECPDLTIGVPGDRSAGRDLGVDRNAVLLVPNTRMLQEGKVSHAWQQGYRSLMQELTRTARAEGYSVLVLNHAGEEDAALCAEIASMCDATQVLGASDPHVVKGILGSAAAVIASRYHACVSAMSQGVPCLGTSWSHKYSALFADFGADTCVLNECDSAMASDRLRSLLAERDAWSATLLERSRALAGRVDAMWERVAQIIAPGHA